MPLIVAWAIAGGSVFGLNGWRAGWVAIGLTVLVVGFLPVWMLMVRRPEDLGLIPDRFEPADHDNADPEPEPAFTRRQAMRTPTFWFLALFTVLVFPVQAGVSLHQAPHLIERGLEPALAAAAVSTFALAAGIGGLGIGFLPQRVPVSFGLALLAALIAAATMLMTTIAGPIAGFSAAALFGFGLGGILTLLPVSWADYFGRASFGAIRGVALPLQVLAQAAGPILSGVLHDLTGDYVMSLPVFTSLSVLAMLSALLVRMPRAALDRKSTRLTS